MAKLPKPKFNLRVAKAKSETLISLVFRYHGKRLVFSTGHSIHPKDWDFKTQRPIMQQRRPALLIIKRALDDLDSICTKIFIESDYGDIEPKEFRRRLDIKFNQKGTPEPSRKRQRRVKKKPTFLQFLDMEIAEMRAANMNKGSIKMFKNHVEIIKRFAKQKGKFNYGDVDWNLRLKLIDWLTANNVQLAYGNKTLGVLRQFMERARRKKLHSNTQYYGTGWRIPQKKAKGQYVVLNPEELQLIADLKLCGFNQKVRDLFLIGAGTGQRFSDYSKYTPDNFYRTINNVPILSIISQKTDTPAKVPLKYISVAGSNFRKVRIPVTKTLYAEVQCSY